jgi:hypothetical protein
VTIPAGTATATFVMTTRPVSLETFFEISASFGDQIRPVVIRLTP